ncbi:family 10 glycosylhydrolase [Ruminococcus sp.]|uniref:glycoside hydrolase family 10 protein n=1 Tax=Ruminococcus sp. TaxID=41978 RepID=UPI0015A1889A|nr:family 10 glycosylhydrolase [Ruminococcus sp.]
MKNKKIVPIIVSVIAMLSVICISSFTREKPPKKQNDINNIAALSSKATADTPESDEEMCGVWVSYMELSMENESSKTQKAFENKFNEIAQKCRESGFNTLIVQVRPFCDALYKSSYFPWSHILAGTQGVNPQYDALQIMCDICKENNLKIHAWINPYRVSSNETPKKLSDNNPYIKNPEIAIKTDNGIFLDPSNETAQQLICDGVKEIAEKYDVDGIQFDDYFYPTKDESFDKKQYQAYIEKYGKENSMNLDNWRMQNVNTLICKVYRTIKSMDSSVEFGISPQGNIGNNDGLYADVKSWCTCKGFADYISPQIYFSLENPALNFEDCLNSWTSLDFDENVKLYVGLGGYKAGNGEYDEETWLLSDSILADEYDILRNNKSVRGFMLYSYSCLEDDTAKKEINNLINALN